MAIMFQKVTEHDHILNGNGDEGIAKKVVRIEERQEQSLAVQNRILRAVWAVATGGAVATAAWIIKSVAAGSGHAPPVVP
tara:strand:- start:4130 stop:4369 length:240 start_codon:yes stop_codon:yes gene_type:complete